MSQTADYVKNRSAFLCDSAEPNEEEDTCHARMSRWQSIHLASNASLEARSAFRPAENRAKWRGGHLSCSHEQGQMKGEIFNERHN